MPIKTLSVLVLRIDDDRHRADLSRLPALRSKASTVSAVQWTL